MILDSTSECTACSSLAREITVFQTLLHAQASGHLLYHPAKPQVTLTKLDMVLENSTAGEPDEWEDERPQETEDVEDYMTMVLPDQPKHRDSVLQKRLRLEISGKEWGRIKSKAELRAEIEQGREKALQTAIGPSSRGFQMMRKMGFKGGSLGREGERSETALLEPLSLNVKIGRAGLGIDEQNKRKADESAVTHTSKCLKLEQQVQDFRGRASAINAEHRNLRNIDRALKQAVQLGELDISSAKDKALNSNELSTTKLLDADPHVGSCSATRHGLGMRSTSESTERERDLKHERLARTKEIDNTLADNGSNKQSGLEEFDCLDSRDQLLRLTGYMRNAYNYCFWCGFQYASRHDMEDECPGVEEDQH